MTLFNHLIINVNMIISPGRVNNSLRSAVGCLQIDLSL